MTQYRIFSTFVSGWKNIKSIMILYNLWNVQTLNALEALILYILFQNFQKKRLKIHQKQNKSKLVTSSNSHFGWSNFRVRKLFTSHVIYSYLLKEVWLTMGWPLICNLNINFITSYRQNIRHILSARYIHVFMYIRGKKFVKKFNKGYNKTVL